MSPLLANVLLDEVDQELERRDHAFVRYADDLRVFVGSKKAGERVMNSLVVLLGKLHLRVNESRSTVARVWNRPFLGTALWMAPGRFRDLDQWIRHRLRAYQLKQWKRGKTVFRELLARGMSRTAAARVAANARRWWHNSAMSIHIALPNSLFEGMGLPSLVA